MTTETLPVLYILMRTDLPSMNPGKAMAQASHASNAFVFEMEEAMADGLHTFEPSLEPLGPLFDAWKNTTRQGFGTVLVLGTTESQMGSVVDLAKDLGFASNTVNDPTYPAHLDTEVVDLIPKFGEPKSPWTMESISAGEKTVTFRSEDTCAYVFGDKNSPMLQALLGRFKLHP